MNAFYTFLEFSYKVGLKVSRLLRASGKGEEADQLEILMKKAVHKRGDLSEGLVGHKVRLYLKVAKR
ncbi:MAG: hypothetical protein HRT88_07940 [Lentisphaeraceae bacterium]|nr:hypothetical protein [Lentisphaeraceae bacterium]